MTAMMNELDYLFRMGLHRLQKVEWLNCLIKTRAKALSERVSCVVQD